MLPLTDPAVADRPEAADRVGSTHGVIGSLVQTVQTLLPGGR